MFFNKAPQSRENLKSAANLVTVSKGGGAAPKNEDEEKFVMLEVFKNGSGAGRNGSAKKQKEKYGGTKKTASAKKPARSALESAIEGVVGKSIAVRNAAEEYKASVDRDRPMLESTTENARAAFEEDRVAFNSNFIKNPQRKLDSCYVERVEVVDFLLSNVIDICNHDINKNKDPGLKAYIDNFKKINKPANSLMVLGALAKRWTHSFRDKDEMVEQFLDSFTLSEKMRTRIVQNADDISDVSAHMILDVVVQSAKHPEVGMTDWRADLENVKNYVDTCSGFGYSSTVKAMDKEAEQKILAPMREQFAKIERFADRVRIARASPKI